MSIKTEIKSFLNGFRFAWNGMICCVKTQRNMRFHTGAAIIAAFLSFACGLTAAEKCAVFLSIGAVLAMECINTAVEYAVDLICGEKRSPVAKAAKDCAAGGVLCAAVISLCVGGILFLRKNSINALKCLIYEKPYLAVIMAIFCAVWLIWVFAIKKDKINN